ncbi:hypothetical protein [Hyphomonas johnsonii]|jgi:TM2 domain-containing membrane protein YozV|uniref:TM2 domain-containing protein n=1 Tax=Hyphomonas johnsonii MHS-2 TaxID=1280950 RepID=A0A059FFQ6_9PROT|nr:hypothetical protein [Hyphomonas johnsonii]KCZ89432.1 hypothetical protein HJO_14477 [Hyphomonas johnsonii MHS-2]
MSGDPPSRRLNDASHYYDPDRDVSLNPDFDRPRDPGLDSPGVGVVKAAAKGTFKFVAFILNFFIPGLGTIFVGRIGTAIIQLALIPVGILLIPFGGIGILVLVANWVWGLLTVVQAWRKPVVVYVQHNRPR